MTRTIIVLILSSVVFASTRYDSHGTLAVDASIQDGMLFTTSSSSSKWHSEIRAQLQFIIGQFNESNTPGLWHSLDLDFRGVTRANNRNIVHYDARFLLAWDRPGSNVPASVEIILPVVGRYSDIEQFSQKYGAQCGNGDPLWYHFHPDFSGCPLSQNSLPEDAQRVVLHLSVSTNNTSNKSPEYQRIWEDGKLVSTHVRGNADSRPDIIVHDLVRSLGSNYKVTFRQNRDYQTTISENETASGKVILRTMQLITGNIQDPGAAFIDEFSSYLPDSDVIGYNGHAGLGMNIRAFTKLIRFEPNRYYLVWLNACIPFAYFDRALFSAQKNANPGSPWTKNLDILTVTRIGWFSEGSDMQNLISVLVARKKKYRDFLDSLAGGAPAVLGEQDN
jgi:hypothetical protein